MSGKDVSKLEKTNISELVLFVYCCVKSACNADKVEFDYDFQSFADLMEPDAANSFYEDMGGEEKNDQPGGKEVSVEELLGMALGCIGMSREDFERCTLLSFTRHGSDGRKPSAMRSATSGNAQECWRSLPSNPMQKAIFKRMTFYRSLGMKSRKKSVRR